MDRMDHKSFRSLLNEATSVLTNKNNNSDSVSLEEAVSAGMLTEEQAQQISDTIFEQSILVPHTLKLIEEFENYYGVELTEEEIQEAIGAFGGLLGGAAGLVARGARAVGRGIASGAKAVGSRIGKGISAVADTAAAGERARAGKRDTIAAETEASTTVGGKLKGLGKMLVPGRGIGSSIAAGFRKGAGTAPAADAKPAAESPAPAAESPALATGASERKATGASERRAKRAATIVDKNKDTALKFGKAGDPDVTSALKAKLKGKGLGGKVKVKVKDGKYHVTDASGKEHMIDHYIFNKQDNNLILENIIRR